MMDRLRITKEEHQTILEAAEKGDVPTLEKIVRTVAEKSDVTEGTVLYSVRSQDYGSTALHLAVMGGHSGKCAIFT